MTLSVTLSIFAASRTVSFMSSFLEREQIRTSRRRPSSRTDRDIAFALEQHVCRATIVAKNSALKAFPTALFPVGHPESSETTEICCLWSLAHRMRHFVAFDSSPFPSGVPVGCCSFRCGDGASVTRKVTLDSAQADAESL